MYNDKNLMNN